MSQVASKKSVKVNYVFYQFLEKIIIEKLKQILTNVND